MEQTLPRGTRAISLNPKPIVIYVKFVVNPIMHIRPIEKEILMPEDIEKPKPRSFQRHLREETVFVNGTKITFFRDRKKRRWNWRAIDAQVTLPDPESNRASADNESKI